MADVDPEVELDGKIYRQIGDTWYDAETFIRAPKVLARRLDVRLRATQPAPKKPASARKSSSRSSGSSKGSKGRSFSHDDAFPIIAEVIRDCYEDDEDYVTHKKIVAGLMDHPEGGEMIEEAAEHQGNSTRWVAGNMVAWFSKRITEERSPYQDDFERERISGAWAYRPVGE